MYKYEIKDYVNSLVGFRIEDECVRDEDNNSWSMEYLINCDDYKSVLNSLQCCEDCYNCSYCYNCIDCEEMVNCEDCEDSYNCINSNDCKYSEDCVDLN